MVLGSLVSTPAAPGTSWDAFPSRSAMGDGSVQLMEEPHEICCLGSPGHPQLQGAQSQSNKALGTRCAPRCHAGRQLLCLGSALWALEATWECSVAGLDDDDWKSCCQLHLVNWHSTTQKKTTHEILLLLKCPFLNTPTLVVFS